MKTMEDIKKLMKVYFKLNDMCCVIKDNIVFQVSTDGSYAIGTLTQRISPYSEQYTYICVVSENNIDDLYKNFEIIINKKNQEMSEIAKEHIKEHLNDLSILKKRLKTIKDIVN